jgi:hypothetical protein
MAKLEQYDDVGGTVSVTIANGTSVSPAFDLIGCRAVGIQMPGTWSAAGLSFQASIDGTNYFKVMSTAGAELTYTVAASQCITVPPNDLRGFRYLKLQSGTSGVPVNQGADRVVIISALPARD